RHLCPAQAQALFKRAWRNLFPRFFRAYIGVLDFHRSGKIHLHLIVALDINVRAGWNFEVDTRHRELQKQIRAQHRRATADELKLLSFLAGGLTSNTAVKSLWRDLRVGLKAIGFSSHYPFELKPIREPKKLARYLARRFRESRAARRLRPPHCHCRRFSQR